LEEAERINNTPEKKETFDRPESVNARWDEEESDK
jgi:hypothetical protein